MRSAAVLGFWFKSACLDLSQYASVSLAMKEDVFVRTLKAFAQRKPFKPFLVQLVSGQLLAIDHPEALVYRGRAAMHVDQEGNFTLFDNDGISRLADIKRNGAKRRP